MKTVVIENDLRVEEQLRRYIELTDDETTYIYNANNQRIEVFQEAFAENDVILFYPTLITTSQYQGLMMILWSLIQEDKCKVTEVHIFGLFEEKENELREVLSEKDDYLEEVLEKIKVFKVFRDSLSDYEKEEIIF